MVWGTAIINQQHSRLGGELTSPEPLKGIMKMTAVRRLRDADGPKESHIKSLVQPGQSTPKWAAS